MGRRKTITIDAPKHPVVRYRVDDARHLTLDLRGIRDPHNPFQGGLNPSKGGGRKFLTPEHLQSRVDEYFESCMGPMFDKHGELVRDAQGNLVKTQVKPYTLSGLALHLGVSTQTLKKYREGRLDTILDEMRAETEDVLTFSRVVLRAKQTIEAYAEGRLYDRDGSNGARFVLDCCYGWVARREQAEISRSKKETKLRQEEFELKKRLIDEDEEDSNFTINIVRGRRNNDED
jgi:hypothetical protein